MGKAAAVPCCQCFPSVSSNAGTLCGEQHDMHKTMRRTNGATVRQLRTTGMRVAWKPAEQGFWAQARAEASRVSHQHGPPGFPAPKVTEGYAD